MRAPIERSFHVEKDRFKREEIRRLGGSGLRWLQRIGATVLEMQMRLWDDEKRGWANAPFWKECFLWLHKGRSNIKGKNKTRSGRKLQARNRENEGIQCMGSHEKEMRHKTTSYLAVLREARRKRLCQMVELFRELLFGYGKVSKRTVFGSHRPVWQL